MTHPTDPRRSPSEELDEFEIDHNEDERVRQTAGRWLVEYDARKHHPGAEDSAEAYLIRALFYRWNDLAHERRAHRHIFHHPVDGVVELSCELGGCLPDLEAQLSAYVTAAEGRPASELIAPSEVERMVREISSLRRDLNRYSDESRTDD